MKYLCRGHINFLEWVLQSCSLADHEKRFLRRVIFNGEYSTTKEMDLLNQYREMYVHDYMYSTYY